MDQKWSGDKPLTKKLLTYLAILKGVPGTF